MTWMLVALVLAPGVLGPTGGAADLHTASATGRECRDPLAGDYDPLEEEPDPIEDAGEEGPRTEFLHPSSITLLRLASRELPGPARFHAGRDGRPVRPRPRGLERSSLAGSGRMLRRWLQSDLC